MNTPSLFDDLEPQSSTLDDNSKGAVGPAETAPTGSAPSAVDLSALNDAQREAVLTTDGPLLVLAGAGSGKTRVLTYRIAHLVADKGAAPWQILAITFTNKAAGEMRERIAQQLGNAASGMWIATFHAACVRILRAEATHLGYRNNFTIYDDDDSKRLIKDIMRELHIDPQHFPIAAIRNKISTAKNELKLPEDLPEFGSSPQDRHTRSIYERYQKRLMQANAMDFDDLLLNVALLFAQHPKVLATYQSRFHYILVDEYQDTNHAQYLITKQLAAKHRNLMVVGDDDQSIYSWRGADLSNILDFERDYPEARTIKLEKNYRSTANILNAANALVTRNAQRKDKKLYTDNPDGELISHYLAANEHDEARYIAAEIERIARRESRQFSDFAIFYRTNAQSRVLEDALLRAGLGYRIVGGTRYFDRAEIRDVMAYLKVVVNPDDDISLMRIINTPRRGIGNTSIAAVQDLAARNTLPFEAALRLAMTEEESDLRPAAKKAISAFIAAIDNMRSYRGELHRVIEAIIDASGLLAHFDAQNTDEAAGRAENIREFINVAAEFELSYVPEASAETASADAAAAAESDAPVGDGQGTPDDNDNPVLFAFMEWLALRSDLDSLSGESETVTMMTVHTAKGLEYPVVLVAGLEESLFPHANSFSQESIEEERRLAYVAITRARERLVLTHAANRLSFGTPKQNPPSRFLAELPDELMKSEMTGSAGFEGTSGWDKRGDRRGISGHGRGRDNSYGGYDSSSGSSFGGSSSRTDRSESARRSIYDSEPASYGGGVPKAKDTFEAGDTVNHKTFGRGMVVSVSGDSIKINFESKGVKKLMIGFAPIVKIQ